VEQIGRYEVIRPLGSGGMGEVLLARDTQLDRFVAIKRLVVPESAHARHRALKEGRAVARLSHPNIAQLFDVVDTS
jgi:eukaryotic-like serine/threonine-protein kinase